MLCISMNIFCHVEYNFMAGQGEILVRQKLEAVCVAYSLVMH